MLDAAGEERAVRRHHEGSYAIASGKPAAARLPGLAVIRADVEPATRPHVDRSRSLRVGRHGADHHVAGKRGAWHRRTVAVATSAIDDATGGACVDEVLADGVERQAEHGMLVVLAERLPLAWLGIAAGGQ